MPKPTYCNSAFIGQSDSEQNNPSKREFSTHEYYLWAEVRKLTEVVIKELDLSFWPLMNRALADGEFTCSGHGDFQ
jgi:hypothetical protein